MDTPKKRRMNKKLLRQVRDSIAANPDHFYLGNWFCDTNDVEQELAYGLDECDPTLIMDRNDGLKDLIKPEDANCGVKGCIAGWALFLSQDKKFNKLLKSKPMITNWNGTQERQGIEASEWFIKHG